MRRSPPRSKEGELEGRAGPLVGARLELRPLSGDALAAWIKGDGAALASLTGATFPDPPVPPPLMDDALPLMRDRLRKHPEETGLWAWLCVLRATGEAVGSAGFTGLPDAERLLTLGYATYPEFEGRGHASEAAALLADWAMGLPGVAGIRATVPVGHGASLRVAAAAGLSPAGTAHDREAGEVVVLERRWLRP